MLTTSHGFNTCRVCNKLCNNGPVYQGLVLHRKVLSRKIRTMSYVNKMTPLTEKAKELKTKLSDILCNICEMLKNDDVSA